MNRVLTPRNIERVDAAFDRLGVFAKPFTQSINDKITVVGLRIDQRPNHLVAFFGDRVIIRASGTYAVQPAAEMTAPRFNYLWKVGTRVVAYPDQREQDFKGPSWALQRLLTKTRSQAWVVCDTPVVKVEGYAGGIDLAHIEVVGGAL